MELELAYSVHDGQLEPWREELGDGDVVWFGRGEAHSPEHICLATQKDNPYLHRHVGVVRQFGDVWVVQHVGARSSMRIEHRGGTTALLPGGGGVALLAGDSRIVVEFQTGPKTRASYILEAVLDDPRALPPDPPPARQVGTVVVEIRLTPRERAILRVLCEPLSSAEPGTTVRPASYDEIAEALWIVPADQVSDIVNKKIRTQFFQHDPTIRGRRMAERLAAAAAGGEHVLPLWSDLDKVVARLIAVLCPRGRLSVPSPGTTIEVPLANGAVRLTVPERTFSSVRPETGGVGWRRQLQALVDAPGGTLVQGERGTRPFRTAELAGMIALLVHDAGFEVPSGDVVPLLDDVLFHAVASRRSDVVRAAYQQSDFGPFLEAVAGVPGVLSG